VRYELRVKKQLSFEHVIKLQDSIPCEARDEVEETVEHPAYNKTIREYSL
jgi:hypothetical protein